MMTLPASRALGAADLRRLLALTNHLAEDDHDDVPAGVLPEISAMIGSEFAGYAIANRFTGIVGTALTVRGSDGRNLQVPCYTTLFRTHPAFQAGPSGSISGPLAMSELIGRRYMQSLPFYQEFLTPHCAEDLLINPFGLEPERSGFLFVDRGRRRPSARDAAVLQLTAESLRQALRRQRRRQAAEAVRRQVAAAHETAPRLTSLTRREREVVEQLVTGATNREIARSLGITERTVHKHLEVAYRKLGVTNRASVIAAVLQTT